MTDEKFGLILKESLKKVDSILFAKAKEYSFGDRLSNFKRAGKLLDRTPEQALQSFLAKHIVSIFDMLDSGKECDMKLWDEKIVDIMAYMVLLRALIIEKKDKE